MPKIRAIKPRFARHEGLQELECSHIELRPMLTFSCLWMMCDREGRFEWNPKQLKLDILPFVPYDLASTLDLLGEGGFIAKYEVAGKSYGYIPSWKEHQHINVKESASTIPAPPRNRTGTVKAPDAHPQEVEVEHGSGDKQSSRSSSTESVFEKAYQQYPRHVSKRQAEKAWKAALGRRKTSHSIADAEDFIYQRVAKYATVCAQVRREKGFTPHMATWLNGDRFLDDPSEWAAGTNGHSPPSKPKALERKETVADEVRAQLKKPEKT